MLQTERSPFPLTGMGFSLIKLSLHMRNSEYSSTSIISPPYDEMLARVWSSFGGVPFEILPVRAWRHVSLRLQLASEKQGPFLLLLQYFLSRFLLGLRW
jgi:hypothetical protein